MIATISQTTSYEQQLLSVIKRLPPHCVSQVIDFAKFLEFQIIGNKNDSLTDQWFGHFFITYCLYINFNSCSLR